MLEELHIMVDTETLSLASDAVVLSVGYALFETHATSIQRSGVWNLRLKDQLKNRDVSEETLCDFWMKQSQEARELAFMQLPKSFPVDFMHEFRDQIPWENITGLWCKGLHFDIPILESLYREQEMLPPWHYRTPRDLRTLTWLAGMHSGDYVKPTIEHSAEHDAIAQALTVQLALKKLFNPEPKHAAGCSVHEGGQCDCYYR